MHARLIASLLVVLGATSCASAPAATQTQTQGNATPSPTVRTDLAQAAEAASAPKGARLIRFSWTLQDREARFTGKGVARVQEPYHARLDLFGPRGDAYLNAALVGLELRLPGDPANVPIPPAAMLWSTLGVFRAPEEGTLRATTQDGNRTRLEYGAGDSSWIFELVDGLVQRVEWNDSKSGRKTVEVTPGGALGVPKQAVYRDWPAFQQLTLTLDEVTNAEGFPAGIWEVRR